MVPALYVQQQGQAVVTADNLNTPVMGGCLLADLQGFVGVSGMSVYMNGYAAQGDGGQGLFTWNAGVASGNNTTTILPSASLLGGWVRMSWDYAPIIQYQYTTPLTGTSIQIGSSANGAPAQALVLNPAGTIAALSVVFPAGVVDGFKLTISSSQIITALTLSGATISNPLTAMTAGQVASYVWVAQAASWFRA
jgi:hypothetical protein